MYIVTHSGNAHRDEILAISLLLAKYPEITEVLRREPSARELTNNGVLVVDIGGYHHVNMKNFDHHQDLESPCSLHLVAESLHINQHMEELFPWFGLTNIIDTKGPFVAAESVGVKWDVVEKFYNNPFEEFIIDEFQKHTVVEGWLIDLIRKVGNSILKQINFYVQRMRDLEEIVIFTEISGVIALFSPLTNNPDTFIDLFQKKYCPTAGISVCPDSRGPGWRMYRFNDHPRVDFSRLEGYPEIAFAHKGGFIATTKERIPIELVREMLFTAIKKEDV